MHCRRERLDSRRQSRFPPSHPRRLRRLTAGRPARRSRAKGVPFELRVLGVRGNPSLEYPVRPITLERDSPCRLAFLSSWPRTNPLRHVASVSGHSRSLRVARRTVDLRSAISFSFARSSSRRAASTHLPHLLSGRAQQCLRLQGTEYTGSSASSTLDSDHRWATCAWRRGRCSSGLRVDGRTGPNLSRLP